MKINMDEIKVGQKITVIGGSGFVGTNLCKRFSLNQQDFEIIDLKPSKQFPEKCKIADVRDIKSLSDTISGNIVINLAAVHRDDVKNKSAYHDTNVEGAKNVANICRQKKINKIIFTSTVAVYGFAEPQIDENGPIKPFNEYGRTKFAAEEVFRTWNESFANSLIIVRPTVIFGEGNRGNVFNLFNQIARGNFVMIGKGKNKKSMAYIENVCAFLEKCITSNVDYGVYNYVDTPDLTMNELVELVKIQLKGNVGTHIRLPYIFALLMGYIADVLALLIRRSFLISSIRVKKFITSSEIKSAKADLDGFSPPVTLSEGITRTLNSEFISPDPYQEVFYSE